ncbi:MAG: IS66 family transposase zinc-finger binding domain-containing protein, partial [Bacteriovorax sp.]|nr:IS66 family transposase zinc-finger binding domain-containing protein [Bacteriovorax sp.]
MKTVVKIDPELEYENAKKIIDLVSKQMLDSDQISSLDSSVANLATVARVLLEREARRRGPPKPNPKNKTPKNKNNKERENSSKLPSVKYPDIELREEIVRPAVVPTCPCCSSEMKESGLFDLTEKLEVEPKKYYIQRSKRVKFNCSKCY